MRSDVYLFVAIAILAGLAHIGAWLVTRSTQTVVQAIAGRTRPNAYYGKQETARRAKQIASGFLMPENGLER